MPSTPAHKQTDPAKSPGQIINPLPCSLNHDMMDDQSMYAMMNSKPRDQTLGDYVRRKTDWQDGAAAYASIATSAEEKQAVLDGQAFCARMFDRARGVSCNDFKPGRDLPEGWDHV